MQKRTAQFVRLRYLEVKLVNDIDLIFFFFFSKQVVKVIAVQEN